MLPLPQEWPQEPQFWLSDWTLMQAPLHSIWPEEQLGPAEGLAQPATKSAEPRAATQAKKEIVRETILDSLWGIGAAGR